MSDDGPGQRNPLSPYYPSEAPDVPTEGRRWVALFLLFVILSGAIVAAVSFLLTLL